MSHDIEQKIYEAALELFKKFGPKKVSIDMIVEKAGVGKGSFYNYYKNKEELYEKMIDDVIFIAKGYMNKLVEVFPNPHERLIADLINSFHFFCNSDGIIGNLMKGNKDYYLGKIDSLFLEQTHREFIEILLGEEIFSEKFKKNPENIKFIGDLFSLYKYAVHMKPSFENLTDFQNFMVRLAHFYVSGIFSKDFDMINTLNYDDYKDKLYPFDGIMTPANKY